MKQNRLSLFILSFSLIFSGCSFQSESSSPEAPSFPTEVQTEATLPPETAPLLSDGEILLQTLTLREKVGQLFIVRPDALDLSIPQADVDNSTGAGVTELTDVMAETLRTYPVGGLIHFQKNIVSPEQITAFNGALSLAIPIAPFLAVDEEGGLVARLANSRGFSLPKYKNAAAVGTQGPAAAQEMGQTIGGYLSTYGFNMDFAPVADTNTNPRNPVIGTRAFSSDPNQAALCARAMADGLRQNGIIPVFKHFPGHGDTAEDSHEQIAVSRKTVQELLACEWIPFLQAEDRECIMVGHIALPEVTGDLTPATLSPQVIKGCLQQELGYEGLVITDSLAMGAITRNASPGEAALAALEAGCDLLLMPASLAEAFDAVLAAAENGSYPLEQLDATVLRILNAKLDYHLITP